MPSTFKGLSLFAGPHRFARAKRGRLVLPNLSLGNDVAGSVDLGAIEVDIVVTGRLVASSEGGLRALRDAMTGAIDDPPDADTPGELVDSADHAEPDMTFITYVEADRTDRGRDRSIAYVATFRRFLPAP